MAESRSWPYFPGCLHPGAACTDAVPTEVNVGPDGALYVSLLTGAPFTAGAAGIYRVAPGQAPGQAPEQAPELYQGGFQSRHRLRLRSGWLPVCVGALHSDDGLPNRHARPSDEDRTKRDSNGDYEGAQSATGVIVDENGVIYVSNNGVAVGTGEVLKIVP